VRAPDGGLEGLTVNRRGWVVTLAGMGLNLALGILYAWSVFSKQLVEPIEKGGFGWTKTEATLPYTLAIACFALMMVPAGRLQDKLGPRLVASAGGALTGLGLLLASFASPEVRWPAVVGFGLLAGTGFGLGYAAATPAAVKWFPPERKGLITGLGLLLASFASPEVRWPAVVGFGLLAGTGFGLGYAAATPAAVKWFPPERKGLITGLVVAGFGVAPVYIAPLSKYLLGAHGIQNAFRALGFAFLVVAIGFSQLIANPDAATLAKRPPPKPGTVAVDRSWREVIRTWTFWSLWLQYACAATAGLMIIGHIAKIVAVQSSGTIQAGFVFVALLAAFNAGGRVVAGVVSDVIGRVVTIALVCLSQSLAMFFFDRFDTISLFVLGSAVVGFSYGACLSLFPSTAADTWGTKNLGLNYGLLFTAWGVGGVIGPTLAGKIADATGSYQTAYRVAGLLLIVAIVLAMFHYVEVGFSAATRQLVIRVGPAARPEPANAAAADVTPAAAPPDLATAPRP
jgi:MFS family permease